jgi:hypothetical protein
MAMSKTALRTTIGRTNQKLGQENHFLQKFRREIEKYMQRRETMQAQAWRLADNLSTPTNNTDSTK